jgi:hypothetical protein
MLQSLYLWSMLGPSFLRVTNISDLDKIIFSCMWERVPRNESTW